MDPEIEAHYYDLEAHFDPGEVGPDVVEKLIFLHGLFSSTFRMIHFLDLKTSFWEFCRIFLFSRSLRLEAGPVWAFCSLL